MKSYKNRTPYLGIPVPGLKDRIMPEIELLKYRIIENMLVAGTQGVKNVVFDDGDYALERESDDTFEVVLRATGHSPSARGMVGGAYFDAPPEVRWSGLVAGRRHLLYVKAKEGVFADPSKVRAVSSDHGLAVGTAILMATVDLRESEPSVDPCPDGKMYSADVARHASDVENPHGKELHQDVLVMRRTLALEDSSKIVLRSGDQEVSLAVADLMEALAGCGRPEIMDVSSPGSAGVVVKCASGRISAVTVTRIASGDLSGKLGETAIGYHGEDDRADDPEEFVLYNTGDAGLPLRLIVFHG